MIGFVRLSLHYPDLGVAHGLGCFCTRSEEGGQNEWIGSWFLGPYGASSLLDWKGRGLVSDEESR